MTKTQTNLQLLLPKFEKGTSGFRCRWKVIAICGIPTRLHVVAVVVSPVNNCGLDEQTERQSVGTGYFSSELPQKGNEALDTRQTHGEEEKFNKRHINFVSVVDGFESVLFLVHVHTACTRNCTIPGPFMPTFTDELLWRVSDTQQVKRQGHSLLPIVGKKYPDRTD